MNCEHCNKTYKSLSSLNQHKKTAKFCLKIQKGNENIQLNHKCDFCNKDFSTKQHLITHVETCKEKEKIDIQNQIDTILKQKEDEFEEYKTQKEDEFNTILKQKDSIIKMYEIKVEEDLVIKTELRKENDTLKAKHEIYEKDHEFIKSLAKKPVNITNNNTKILNIGTLNIDKDKVKNVFENKFNSSVIDNGQKGLAIFTVDNFLKDEDGNLTYVCTDPSRNIYRYKDSFGEIQKDVNATKLTNLLVEGGINDINNKIAIAYWTNDDGSQDTEKFFRLNGKATEINNLKNDNSVFVSTLSTITILGNISNSLTP